jgi:hypothetical protein
MDINPLAQSGTEFLIVRFPYHDLEICAVKVRVEDSVSKVGNEDFPDIGEESSLVAFGNILEVGAGTERVFRR